MTDDEREKEIERLEKEVKKWQQIRKPSHGPCCTCQRCGEGHDECRCDLDDVVYDLEQANQEIERLKEALREIREFTEDYYDDLEMVHHIIDMVQGG